MRVDGRSMIPRVQKSVLPLLVMQILLATCGDAIHGLVDSVPQPSSCVQHRCRCALSHRHGSQATVAARASAIDPAGKQSRCFYRDVADHNREDCLVCRFLGMTWSAAQSATDCNSAALCTTIRHGSVVCFSGAAVSSLTIRGPPCPLAVT